jgi:hypothetical protein
MYFRYGKLVSWSLTLKVQIIEATTSTTYFNITKLCTLSMECSYKFRTIVKINNKVFPKVH